MSSATIGKWTIAACLAAILATTTVPRVSAQTPDATVTSVDARTGVVTGKVNSTGQVFTFTLVEQALLARVRPCQGVFADLAKNRVTLDGKQPHGKILTLSSLGKTATSPGSAGTTSGASGSGKAGGSTGAGTTSPPPVVFSCGGTTTPLTADTCGKSAGVATLTGYKAACGATATITGTITAGTTDWLMFTVPAPRTNCANHVIDVRISSPGNTIVFDALTSPGGNSVYNSYNSGGNFAALGVHIAGLGSTAAPLQPNTYYFRIYGTTPTAGDAWTLTITG
jgi:hypothetical protein